jgi:hypothetical protein
VKPKCESVEVEFNLRAVKLYRIEDMKQNKRALLKDSDVGPGIAFSRRQSTLLQNYREKNKGYCKNFHIS